MGCNCIFEYPYIQNDITIEITSNTNYKTYKKKSKKNSDEIIIRSVIDDYKALNKNSSKIKLNDKNVSNEIRKIQVPKKSQNIQRISNNTKTVNCISNQGINKSKLNDINNSSIVNNNGKSKNDKTKTKLIRVKKTHPEKITYLKDITKDSFSYFYLDNTFAVFNSINNILTLVYATMDKTIVSFDLIENQKINSIKGAHKELITNIRHIQDIVNKRDLLISISYDNNIKIWDYNLLECLTDIDNIYEFGYILSACFLHDSNMYYIVASSYSQTNDILKVYDLSGNKIQEINDSYGSVSFVDTFYDIKTSKNYIITGNLGSIKSFDYKENKLYHIYSDNYYNDHCSIIINCKKYSNLVRLIESSCDGAIRLWNFHTGILLKRIKIYDKKLMGMCLWSDNYIFVGCEDKTIKLVDIKKGEIINNLIGYKSSVLNIKKITHPKYGDCIISQGFKDNQIKLWVKKFKKKKKIKK